LKTESKLYRGLLLVLISFLALYYEIALIRWIPGQVLIVGYFTNLVLIACFLGLGIGCATVGRTDDNQARFLTRLLILTGLCLAIGRLGSFSLPFWTEAEEFSGTSRIGPVPSFIATIIIFVATAIAQIPLGRMMGEALEGFSPLPGYSLNILGSLLGVSAMALLRLWSIGPVWWFTIGGVLFIPLLFSLSSTRLKRAAVFLPAVIAVVWLSGGDEIWSPYYKIEVSESFDIELTHKTIKLPLQGAGYSISINDTFFQFAYNLDNEFIDQMPDEPETKLLKQRLRGSRAFYEAPYKLFRPKSALILGAGSGNDAAVAADNNVERIVAVEIDPLIAGMGYDLHPMKPYNDPAIQLVIDDARHYLRTTPETFDLIVYGLLDSHRLVSYISTVRLEGFVYTRQGLEEAAARLNPGGVIVLTHASDPDKPQQARLFQTLEGIFPGRVHGLNFSDSLWHTIIAGPDDVSKVAAQYPNLKNVTPQYRAREKVKIATDDWPFIYLTTDAFWKTGFLRTLVIMMVASIVIVWRATPEARGRLSPHFFLLGAGFLLLETKSIIDLSLLFGSTWLVNSVAIGAFLTMALLGNLAVATFKLERAMFFYLMLFAALALNAFVPVGELLGTGVVSRVLLGGGFVALPVFFSGIVFAISFRKAPSPAVALGSNVMGAVVGGFGEYMSLFTGYRFLFLIAGVLYLASWLFMPKRKS